MPRPTSLKMRTAELDQGPHEACPPLLWNPFGRMVPSMTTNVYRTAPVQRGVSHALRGGVVPWAAEAGARSVTGDKGDAYASNARGEGSAGSSSQRLRR